MYYLKFDFPQNTFKQMFQNTNPNNPKSKKGNETNTMTKQIGTCLSFIVVDLLQAPHFLARSDQK